MSYLTILLSPFSLLFFIIITGFSIGKLRIHRISLGIAGILFVAILVAFLMNQFIPETYIELIVNALNTMRVFSKLGTSLFVSVIGLQTGFYVKNNSKGSLLAFTIGSLMSISGVMLMLLISKLDKSISYTSLLGILCGALTSTPGLSSICELIGTGIEEATWGYGCSYLFGVIFVVLFAQLFSRNMKENEAEKSKHNINESKIYPELILISTTALFGGILGSISIPFLHISIGNTASTLLLGLLIGCFVKISGVTIQISSQTLNILRNLGLAFFFAGTGFATGIQPVSFDIKAVIYGALITMTAILCGIFLCKITSSRHHLNNGFVIAGGMTSSPSYGAISLKASESSINHFSFAYFGALISLIIAIQIIGR